MDQDTYKTLPNKTNFGRFEVRIFADNNRTECKYCRTADHPYYLCRDKPARVVRCYNCNQIETPFHSILNPLSMCISKHLTHGTLNPLAMAYRNLYPWYFDPLFMVFRTPYPWYCEPPTHGIILWYYEPPSFCRNKGVQSTMMGFKIQWRKFDPAVDTYYDVSYIYKTKCI